MRAGILIDPQTLYIDYESAPLRIHVQATFFVQEQLNSHMKT